MIMIECKCQHCHGNFEVPDSMIGKTDICPLCRARTELLINVGRPEAPVPRKSPRSSARDKLFRPSFAEEVSGFLAAVCAVAVLASVVWISTGPWRGADPPSIFELYAWLLIGGSLVWGVIFYSALAHILLYLRTIANAAQGDKIPR